MKVMVPDFSHENVNAILEINTHLLRILVEFQNNGWAGADQRVYQQRLQTNLTYLATMADSALKESSSVIATAPSLAPVTYPQQLAHLQPTNTSSELMALIQIQQLQPSKLMQTFVSQIPPPVMVVDPNIETHGRTVIGNVGSVIDSSNGMVGGYRPVAPLVIGGAGGNQEVSIPGFRVVRSDDAREHLIRVIEESKPA